MFLGTTCFFIAFSWLLPLPTAPSVGLDSSIQDASADRQENSPFGAPQKEFMDRAIIKELEASHQETLENAREGAELGASLRTAFEKNRSLSREDLKRLERLEKLARRVRSRTGGSDAEGLLEKPPQTLEAALAQLSELSAQLHQSVAKTSRHVISTAVIERSNEVLQLIRHIRSFAR